MDSRISPLTDNNREETADKSMSESMGSKYELVNIPLPPSVDSACPLGSGDKNGKPEANISAPMPLACTPDHSASGPVEARAAGEDVLVSYYKEKTIYE